MIHKDRQEDSLNGNQGQEREGWKTKMQMVGLHDCIRGHNLAVIGAGQKMAFT